MPVPLAADFHRSEEVKEMAGFRVVLLESGYGSNRVEREIVSAAGGELIDAQDRPLEFRLELCRDAHAILLRRVQVTAGMIAQFRRCRVIVRYGVGTDNIDVEAATDAGIIVANIPDYCIDEVSTHAIGLLLDCVRDVSWTNARMRAGEWDVEREIKLYRMAGRTLGIVGLGQIGSEVARKLRSWNLRILATDPYVEREHAESLGVSLVTLETLCRESDYLSLHLPLLPETHHLIGRREFGLMRRGSILVNTARGAVVDAAALLEALDQGPLARAALDVFAEEPLPPASPLRRHPKVLLTDHLSWYSEDSQTQLQRSAAVAAVTVCTGGLPGSLSNPLVLRKLGRFAEWQPAPCMRWQLRRAQARSGDGKTACDPGNPQLSP
ncbi:MAG: C-terminal binding protein [Acidobacteria bacterium]|nr:C-terminal binding protein [Acidobacteriota bacterium]